MSKLPDAPAPLVPETNPALIVGAGPTGLTAALELSRLGVPVRLLEQRREPATTSRALAVQARTLELLVPRGVGAAMLALGNRAGAVGLHDAARQLARIHLSDIPSRYNFILLLAQAETERLLREQVARQGVAVEWGTELLALAQTEAGVRAVLRGPDGQLQEVAASYLLSTEGAHSLVRHTLGLPFEGRSLPQPYALADLYLDGDLPQDELSIFLSETGLLALFPMGAGRFRLIASDPTGVEAPPALPELQALYDTGTGRPARLHDLVWSSRFRINSRVVAQLRVGRVLLGGDAAHIHSPAGGQGMNTGIQDMVNLGWKLALVWHGQAPASLLDTYALDRLPVIRGVVDTTERATGAISSASPLVHTLLTHALPLLLGSSLVQRQGVAVLSQVAAGYRDSPLSGTVHAGGTLHGGDRLPDLLAVQPAGGAGAVWLSALLDPSRLTLLASGLAALPAGWPAQLHPWQPVLNSYALAPAAGAEKPWQEVLGHHPALVLVRPDGYAAVVARADADGLAAVLNWLRRWLPRPGGA